MEELSFGGLFLGCLLSATIIPFASEAIFLGVLLTGADPMSIIFVATLGNFSGSLITYYMGYLGNFNHLEKWFKIKRDRVYQLKKYIDHYGLWAAALSWAPFIGDPLVLVLGFFRVRVFRVLFIILLVKFLRYFILYHLWMQF